MVKHGRNGRNWIALVLVAVAAAVALPACGGDDDGDESGQSQTEAASQDPIVIGAAVGKTGILDFVDVPALTASEMAIDDINEQGGVLGRQLKLVSADTRSDPNLSANAAIQVLDQKAKMLIVSCDFDFGAPAALEAENRGVLNFSQCGASTKFGESGIGPLSFTMATAAPTEAAILAEFTYERQGSRAAYLLVNEGTEFTQELCESFGTRFTELGGSVVGEDTLPAEDPSIASQINRLKGASPAPDVIMICTFNPALAQAVRQLRAGGVEARVFSPNGGDGTAWHEAVPGLSNFFYAAYGSIADDDPSAAVNDFFKAFETNSGEPPLNSTPLTGYSLIEAYARAVELAETTDSEEVAAALEQMDEEDLLIGPTSYSPEYHINVKRSMKIMEAVAPGELKFVEEWTPSSVPGISE